MASSSSSTFRIVTLSHDHDVTTTLFPRVEAFLKEHDPSFPLERTMAKLRDGQDYACDLAVQEGSTTLVGAMMIIKTRADSSYGDLGVVTGLEICKLLHSTTTTAAMMASLLARAEDKARAVGARCLYMSLRQSSSDEASSSSSSSSSSSWLIRAGFSSRPVPPRYHDSTSSTGFSSRPVPPRYHDSTSSRRYLLYVKDVEEQQHQQPASTPPTSSPAELSRLPPSRPGASVVERHRQLVRLLMDEDKLSSGIYTIPLEQPYLDWIVEGRKKVEARVNTGFCRQWREGDLVLFEGGRGRDEVALARITKLNPYPDFNSLLRSEGVRSCLCQFGYLEIDQAVRSLYRSSPDCRDKEARFGVLAIRLEIVGEDDMAELLQRSSPSSSSPTAIPTSSTTTTSKKRTETSKDDNGRGDRRGRDDDDGRYHHYHYDNRRSYHNDYYRSSKKGRMGGKY